MGGTLIRDGCKVCPQCEENKPTSEYGKNKASANGICCWCLACCRQLDKMRIARTQTGEYKAKKRNRDLVSKYGITLEEYYALLEAQQYKCRICKCTDPGRTGFWKVDHDHSIGHFVRGILCHNCNALLGHAKDSIEILQSAAHYLELQYVAY